MSTRPAPDMGRAADPALIAMALQMARTLGNRFPRLSDEFESSALVGLAEAAATFDEMLGVPFVCHARIRVRGSLSECWRHWRPFGFKAYTHAVIPRVESLDVSHYEDGCRYTVGDTIAADAEPPDAGLEYQDEILSLAGRLSPRHGQVIRYLYRHAECRLLRVTGEAMGLTEGRICQLHKEAIAQLREKLAS